MNTVKMTGAWGDCYYIPEKGDNTSSVLIVKKSGVKVYVSYPDFLAIAEFIYSSDELLRAENKHKAIKEKNFQTREEANVWHAR